MPGLSGLELAEAVAKKLPNLRILFVSGHSSDALSSRCPPNANTDFLQKPYRSDDLAAKVDQVINRRSADADHCLI
jgi:FixJ family two-component response regulator